MIVHLKLQKLLFWAEGVGGWVGGFWGEVFMRIYKMATHYNGLPTQSVSMYLEILEGDASTHMNTIQDTLLTPRYRIWYGCCILVSKCNSQIQYINIECLLNPQLYCLPFDSLLHTPGMNLKFNWSNNLFPYCYISQTFSPHYFIKYR